MQKNYVETEGAASNGQHITYDVIKTSTHPTRISREDNQKLLVCSAEVPDREPEQIAIELRVGENFVLVSQRPNQSAQLP